MQKYRKNNQKKRKTRQRTTSLNAVLCFIALFLLCFNDYSFAQYGSIGQQSGVSSSTLLNNTQSVLVAQAAPVITATPVNGVPVPASVPSTSTVLSGTAALPAVPVFIQPLDPYAVPRTTSLFASSSVPGTVPVTSAGSNSTTLYAAPTYSGQWNQVVPETYQAVRRFREATEFTYTMMPGGKGDNAFGINEVDIRMQLSFPCRFIPHNSSAAVDSDGFFYVAPGLSTFWWNGPVGPPDMPPNGFGAFIDFGINPRFNEVFSMEGWFRLGAYSDFKKVKSEALRYQGRLASIFTVSPTVQIIGGAQYLDRVRLKIIPVGGVIWTPRDDLVLRLTFPNPKISQRFWQTANADWWIYAAADYGGNSWSIDGMGQTDYNDIRVGGGIEFETLTKINGHIEFGGAFNRELYSTDYKQRKLSDAVYLKLGFVF
ncbi:MAG: hypothetical protein FWE67_02895 [Planctomycetaceae bacterium]|nr:hypothetical protein [Planctomycetaceae bacterium]